MQLRQAILLCYLQILRRFLDSYISSDNTSGIRRTCAYDGRGNVITRTNPDNITIYYSYDINSKLTQKSSENSNSAFEYDYAGNMTYAGNQNIAYQFTYDADNRVTRITDSNGRTIQYQYDAAGKRIAMTMPDSSTIAYTYDFNNLLTQME
jgi:YD repeat-containing protein